jgi:hypothetical protein
VVRQFVMSGCAVRTLGLVSGQEKSLLLLVTATPTGAVFLLGGVAMALIALSHIEHRGKPQIQAESGGGGITVLLPS